MKKSSVDVNLLAEGEERSMEEINEGHSNGDDSELRSNEASNLKGLLVAKKEVALERDDVCVVNNCYARKCSWSAKNELKKAK